MWLVVERLMNYKVLLPVTNNPELVEAKVSELDLTKLVLINNFDNSEVELQCKRAEHGGAEVHRYPRNLGLAASWNIGLRKVVEEDLDFVIIISASARLDGPIERFAEAIGESEVKNPSGTRYIASSAASLHCFAHTRKGVDLGGYFDENFWPIYYEDTDFCVRSGLNGVRHGVRSLNLKDMAVSHGACIAMRDRRLFKLFQLNTHRMGVYYQAKWGGVHHNETFKTPFNNPAHGVNDWSVVPGTLVWPPGIYEGDF
jgi:glycosyltransferase involved in cell wall biosynthesis